MKSVEDAGKSIVIGRAGEHLFRTIKIDAKTWLSKYPDGKIQAIYQRADQAIYEVPITVDDGIVLWEPKEVDTYVGLGKLQLQLQIGNILGKSVVFQTVCERSIDERKDDVSIPEAAYKKQTSSYVLELLKYGISSDGSNAESTTKGINQAIADAVANGYSTIVFPKGEYLIAAESQIEITGQLTVDFNNSVLRKEANANASYVMVNISGDHNVVKNATLYGDRETHDYSSGGTHEWGIGIDITADSRFTVIENVDIFDTTGYGINTSVMHNQIEPIRDRPLEAGCYDTSTGELVESTTHTVLGYTLDITDSAIKNTGGLGGLIEIHRPVHDPVVGDRNGGLTQFLGALNKPLDAAGAVQEAELRVNVQVDKCHRLTPAPSGSPPRSPWRRG